MAIFVQYDISEENFDEPSWYRPFLKGVAFAHHQGLKHTVWLNLYSDTWVEMDQYKNDMNKWLDHIKEVMSRYRMGDSYYDLVELFEIRFEKQEDVNYFLLTNPNFVIVPQR
jgi:hypothetical protein